MSILYELKNIEYFFDEKRVLSIDNLILEENKIIGFFGPNGSGKSTLFSILSFISKPQNGEIIIDENIKKDFFKLCLTISTPFEPNTPTSLSMLF